MSLYGDERGYSARLAHKRTAAGGLRGKSGCESIKGLPSFSELSVSIPHSIVHV